MAAEAMPALGLPERIDDFKIVRELGRGGMGVVYEAIEETLGRRVALKMMHVEWAKRNGICERFLEEARSIARMSHPGIVRVHRFAKYKEAAYLALELVEGRSLDLHLAEAKFPVSKALCILQELAEALGHAHEQGVVHRDIKPGNVFLRTECGGVVLGDFGLAKDLEPRVQSLTTPGMIMGTPAYMSPEQAQGKAVTPATDVYALGVLAFEMLTGRVPFTADTAMTLLLKHVNEPPPPIHDFVPELPAEVAALVGRMLEKDPARRPQNGKRVAEAIQAIEKHGCDIEKPTMIAAPAVAASWFDELEVTVAAYELVGFARTTSMSVLPARAAFLLESWYRLAHTAIRAEGGAAIIHTGDRVTAVFGYPQHNADHPQRAVRTAQHLQAALRSFNNAHDLNLEMRAGVACGTALVGRIAGDFGTVSVQGPLLGDMQRISKTKQVPPGIRLNRAAYRRASALGDWKPFKDEAAGDCWHLPAGA